MWLVIIIIIAVVIWAYSSSKKAEREREEARKKRERIAHIKRSYPNAYSEYWGKSVSATPYYQYRKYHNSAYLRIADETFSDFEWEELEKRVLASKKEKKETELKQKADKEWETVQATFSEKMRTLARELLPTYGNYTYTYNIKTKNGTNLNMKIWQHFTYEACLEKDLDYTYNQLALNNTQKLPKQQQNGIFLDERYYKQIYAFISKITEDKKVLVFFNEEINGWSIEALANSYMFELPNTVNEINVAADRALEFESKSGKDLLKNESPECVVVIDAFTTNDQLKNNCEYIFNALQDTHPLLAYISLVKAYDRQEMIEYIERSRVQAKKKAAEEQAKEEERKQMELAKQSYDDRKWEEEQKTFSSEIYNMAIKHIPDIGNCNYNVNYDSSNNEGKPSPGSFSLWQFFPLASCLEEDLDYTNCEDVKNNTQCIQVFRKYGIKLDIASVSKPINKFFVELAANWKCLFFFNDEIKFWSDDALNVTYRSLKTPEGCKTLNIARLRSANKALGLNNTYSSAKESLGNQDCEVIVIVDAFTANGQLFKNIQEILPLCRNHHPKIIYLSILKCYDRKEMLEVINVREKEAEKRKVEEKVKEEERKKKNAEAKELEEKKRKAEIKARLQITAKDVLVNNAKDWECLYGDFYYTWLFYYYPTTCDFEASDSEWNDRWRVWNFKNDPEKDIEQEEHEEALDELIPRIKQRFVETFGEEYLQFLTLVCLPASTQSKNEARYKEFASRLCGETGMENGYEHTHIVKDGMSKNHPANTTNHSIQPVIEFDKDFFKGKYVLLFDDVVTKGGTMLRYKDIMKSIGATVVGGMCLGKTKHERP